MVAEISIWLGLLASFGPIALIFAIGMAVDSWDYDKSASLRRNLAETVKVFVVAPVLTVVAVIGWTLAFVVMFLPGAAVGVLLFSDDGLAGAILTVALALAGAAGVVWLFEELF